MTAAGQRSADKPFGWRFVLPLCIGAGLNPINSTMVATALATIGRELEAGADQTVWLVSVMYLSSAISQPVSGRIADRVGPRKVFVAGTLFVAAAGLAGIFVHSLVGLVVLRAVIGIGTGAVYPAAMAMVRRRADSIGLPPPNRVLGLLSTASLVTLTIGPLLAGVLVQYLDWRWIFIVNLPIALISLAAVMWGTPADGPLHPGGLRGLDIPGMVVFALAISALLVFLMGLQQPAWWVLALAVALWVGFARLEWRRTTPFLDVRMLAANKPLLLTYARVVVGFTVLYGAMFALALWAEEVRGLTPSAVGLYMLLIFGVGSVLSLGGGRFIDSRWPLLLGGSGLLLGSVLMVIIDRGSPLTMFALLCLVFSPGAGLTNLANQMAIYVQAPADQIGSASGLMRTAQYLGAIIAAGVIGLQFGDRPTDAGLHAIGWLMAALSATLLAMVFADRSLWTARRTA